MIFITGANGLLGSNIARRFIHAGVKVSALKRKDSDLSLCRDIMDEIEWIEGDMLDLEGLKKKLNGFELVIHCAGLVSYQSKDKEHIYTINLEGTRNLINVCLSNQIPKFIFISSISTFSSVNDTKTINEHFKQDLEYLNSNYAKSKYLAELEVWRGHMEGLRTIILNPSVVFGPGDWNKSSTRIFKYIYHENPFFIKGSLNYVDVRDLAEIVMQLSEKEFFGDQYIVNAGSVNYKELFDKIASRFNKKAPQLNVSFLILEVAYFIDKMISFITGKNPLISKELGNAGKKRKQYSSQKLMNSLDYTFTSLDDTLHWTCKQLVSRYN